MFDYAASTLPTAVVNEIIQQQTEEIERRIRVLRDGAALPALAGRTVVLVDDGIVMGSTVRAGIALCRKQDARRIIVASPVASPATADELTDLADDVVIVEKPRSFRAVAQVYQNWYDVPDEEVVAIMRKFARRQA